MTKDTAKSEEPPCKQAEEDGTIQSIESNQKTSNPTSILSTNSEIEEKEVNNKNKDISKITEIKVNYEPTHSSKKPAVKNYVKKDLSRQLPAWMVGGCETQTKEKTTGVYYICLLYTSPSPRDRG